MCCIFDDDNLIKEDLGLKQINLGDNFQMMDYEDLSSEEEVEKCREWKPVLINDLYNNDQINFKNWKSDTMSYLINIFGSIDDFLSEYKSFLISKFVGEKCFNLLEEERILRLLKRRFGADKTAELETVINDIKENGLQLREFKCAVLTGELWNLKEKQHFEFVEEIHGEVVKTHRDIRELFKIKQKNINLNYLNAYGKTKIEVKLPGKKVFYLLSALTYAVLTIINREKRALSEIAEMLKTTEEAIRFSADFLLHQGLIVDREGLFYVGTDIKAMNEEVIVEREALKVEFKKESEVRMLSLEGVITQLIMKNQKKTLKEIAEKARTMNKINVDEKILKEVLAKMKIEKKIFEQDGFFYVLKLN